MLCSLEQRTCTPFNWFGSAVLPWQGSGSTLPQVTTGEGQYQPSQLLQVPMGKGGHLSLSLTTYGRRRVRGQISHSRDLHLCQQGQPCPYGSGAVQGLLF